MKLAGVAWLDCGRSTQEFTCYMAGLVSPCDHTCVWTTSTLHSHPAWRYWFRWGCGASSETGTIAEPSRACPYRRPAARNTRRALASQQQYTGESHSSTPPSQPIRSRHTPVTSRCTRSVTVHPLRCDAPDQKGCNAYGSGAPPPTTSTTAGTPSQHTTTGSIRRSHTASKYSHRFRARPAAPVTSRCTRSEGV